MNKINKLDNHRIEETASVHGLSHDGRGVATINQKTAFIAGSLPGETVTFKITQKRSTFIEANINTIITASENRIEPPCQHFGICGGCSLQHMDTATQIAFKQNTVLEQLKHFGKATPESIIAPLDAQSLGYRRKARLGVKFVTKKDKLLVGFREKSSRYLADLERCVVLHPKVGEQFEALKTLISSLQQFQHIPQIEVAIGDTDTALVFRHMNPLPDEDVAALKAFGAAHECDIYLQPNPPASVHKIYPENTPDRLRYTLPDHGLEFLFHPLDFTQVNLEMNRLMVNQALSLLELKQDETVLDLFCGIGNFTLPMAKQAATVTGIEGSDAMVLRAQENAAHNGITNTEYFAANLEKPDANANWAKKTYDKILLDPPRVGAKEILPLIPTWKAKRIVYVSCNPATLARDAYELIYTYKYQLKKVGIMNMFPQTSHIEAMAVFEAL